MFKRTYRRHRHHLSISKAGMIKVHERKIVREFFMNNRIQNSKDEDEKAMQSIINDHT